eukprot:CAMPEP_0168539900 /NCGR_PEP_ID=MMETSP0405-20121227/22123_1 /TAXON_ID=498012 /ORGANISM="Trichosphaerium sp, Strain Am-I-7 wt" /LENGTH=238 /DNA_ID=CAMNT_0008569591 /DNA_START=59 /DNA_END=776 /DNA_ORIENTATION=-
MTARFILLVACLIAASLAFSTGAISVCPANSDGICMNMCSTAAADVTGLGVTPALAEYTPETAYTFTVTASDTAMYKGLVVSFYTGAAPAGQIVGSIVSDDAGALATTETLFDGAACNGSLRHVDASAKNADIGFHGLLSAVSMALKEEELGAAVGASVPTVGSVTMGWWFVVERPDAAQCMWASGTATITEASGVTPPPTTVEPTVGTDAPTAAPSSSSFIVTVSMALIALVLVFLL